MAFDTQVPAPEPEIRFQPFYDNWREIAKVETLFRSYQGLYGELIVVNSSETGPDVASMLAEEETISAAGRRFGNFVPDYVEISSSLTLQQSAHAGRLLYCINSSAIIIGVELSENPEDGVRDGFACTILRGGSGSVALSFSGISNRHPALHTRISQGLAATIFVDGFRAQAFFLGGTEP